MWPIVNVTADCKANMADQFLPICQRRGLGSTASACQRHHLQHHDEPGQAGPVAGLAAAQPGYLTSGRGPELAKADGFRLEVLAGRQALLRGDRGSRMPSAGLRVIRAARRSSRVRVVLMWMCRRVAKPKMRLLERYRLFRG